MSAAGGAGDVYDDGGYGGGIMSGGAGAIDQRSGDGMGATGGGVGARRSGESFGIGGGVAESASDSGLINSAIAQSVPMDEADVDLLRNFGEHALMDRVQKALEKQLRSQLARAEAELRDRQEAGDKAKRARENAGVELYGVQQQLAKLQQQLDSMSLKVTALHDIRTKAETELKASQDAFASRKTTIEAEEQKLEKFRGELDGINDTLRQVEAYTREMGDEIALSKRVGAKAEEEMTDKERAKVEQDLYIDSLTSQIKRASEQLAVYDAQIAAQRAETAAAAGTMVDAVGEMEIIEGEKKQLMSQWQSSLVAMRRRDEALAAIHASIRKEQEALEAMTAEEANVRKDIAAARATQAQLREQLEKEEQTLRFLEGNAVTLQRQLEGLEEQHTALGGQLEATEAQVARVVLEAGKMEKALREMERQRLLVDKQRFGVEDEIAELVSSRATADKAAKALVKDARSLISRVHDIELQCADVENAIAASKVDALHANSRLSELREREAAAEADVREKEKLVERYESEIKQRSDAIDKKMVTVARLNRKYEKLVADTPEAEHTGPLQAEVHNLMRGIQAKREGIEALQKRWLMDQTALVSAANDAETKSTRLRELQSQLVLLDQKRLRLDGAIEAQRVETKRLEGALSTMHEDMTRISALIAKNDKLAAKMAAASSVTEAAFVEELRALEREAAQAEARVLSQREEKGRLIDDLLECERQIVLWEKKITLEKETQETLDPSVGESEIAGMEKDINRMKGRLDALKREQERLVSEMERAIHKREVIAMKNKSASALTLASAAATGKGLLSGTGKRGEGAKENTLMQTKVGLRQRALTLQRDIEVRLKQASEVEAAIAAKQETANSLLEGVKAKSEELTALEARAAALQRSINACLYEKQKGIETASSLTRMLQRLEALEAGRLPSLTGDEAARVGERLAEAEGVRENVRRLVRTLGERHVELSEVLERVSQLIDIAPPLAL